MSYINLQVSNLSELRRNNLFRGIVEDAAAMLAFPDIQHREYLGRLDTGTIWVYDQPSNQWTDTTEIFNFQSIVNLENEVQNIFATSQEMQDDITDLINSKVYENSTTLLNTNQTVYADGSRGFADPNQQVSGWYYKNSLDVTDKINWYFMGNLNPQQTMNLTSLTSGYVVINYRSGAEIPFFSIYTSREFDGNDAGAWYRSRLTYHTNHNLGAYVGQDVLLYFGDDTGIFPSLPRFEMLLDPFSSAGPQGALENILVGALSTSTGYPAASYEFVASTLGYVNGSNRTDFDLIADIEDIPDQSVSYSNTHYIALDATNDFIDLTSTGNVLDFLSSWSLGIEFEELSTVQDNTYIVLYKSGNNAITLRKGGSNWGIYCFSNGSSCAQANTWVAPQIGSKALIQCNGTTIQYWLDGTLRASMTMNSNKNNTSHIVDSLEIGKGGISSTLGTLNYWYGGLNNLMVSDQYFSTDTIAEYFGSEDVSTMSFYDDDVVDFCLLGEDIYPNVTGLKAVVSGTFENGTPGDFVEK